MEPNKIYFLCHVIGGREVSLSKVVTTFFTLCDRINSVDGLHEVYARPNSSEYHGVLVASIVNRSSDFVLLSRWITRAG